MGSNGPGAMRGAAGGLDGAGSFQNVVGLPGSSWVIAGFGKRSFVENEGLLGSFRSAGAGRGSREVERRRLGVVVNDGKATLLRLG